MDIVSREAKDMKNRGHEALQVIEQEKPCYRCGSPEHLQEKCQFKDQKCHKCGKTGAHCQGLQKFQFKAVHRRKVWKRISLKSICWTENIRSAGSLVTQT